VALAAGSRDRWLPARSRAWTRTKGTITYALPVGAATEKRGGEDSAGSQGRAGSASRGPRRSWPTSRFRRRRLARLAPSCRWIRKSIQGVNDLWPPAGVENQLRAGARCCFPHRRTGGRFIRVHSTLRLFDVILERLLPGVLDALDDLDGGLIVLFSVSCLSNFSR